MSIGKVVGVAAGFTTAVGLIGGAITNTYKGIQFERTPMPLAEISEELAGVDSDGDNRLKLIETQQLFKTVIDRDQNGFLSTDERLKLEDLNRKLLSADHMFGFYRPYYKYNLVATQDNLDLMSRVYDKTEALKVYEDYVKALRD